MLPGAEVVSILEDGENGDEDDDRAEDSSRDINNYRAQEANVIRAADKGVIAAAADSMESSDISSNNINIQDKSNYNINTDSNNINNNNNNNNSPSPNGIIGPQPARLGDDMLPADPDQQQQNTNNDNNNNNENNNNNSNSNNIVTFQWEINDFTKIPDKKHYSSDFVVAGYKWYVYV